MTPVKASTAEHLKIAASEIREWTERRDGWIMQALAEGASLREVGKLAGMTGPGILAVKRRMEA